MSSYPVIQALTVGAACIILFVFAFVSALVRSRWRRIRLSGTKGSDHLPIIFRGGPAGAPASLVARSVTRSRFALRPPVVPRDVPGLLECWTDEPGSGIVYEDVRAVAAQAGQRLTALCRTKWLTPQSSKAVTFADCTHLLLEQAAGEVSEDQLRAFVDTWQALRYGADPVSRDTFFAFLGTYRVLITALDPPMAPNPPPPMPTQTTQAKGKERITKDTEQLI